MDEITVKGGDGHGRSMKEVNGTLERGKGKWKDNERGIGMEGL